MPFCPFFCPYMNNLYEEDEDFRSSDEFQFVAQGGPPGPPPSQVPLQAPSVQFVDPGAIRPCRFQFVYIWPSRGRPFWAWLTFVGPRSIAGFRWVGNNWRFFGMDLRQIRSFQCF